MQMKLETNIRILPLRATSCVVISNIMLCSFKEIYYTDMAHCTSAALPLYGEEYIKISVFYIKYFQK
jgi:hypothetical protein